ncbi:MAG: hypothetical protein Q8M98_11940 [Candidatus Cloacimonadaceae bacterium]|nr:hypothetical protein [Candidatus Cloacimonadaceae bacterium]
MTNLERFLSQRDTIVESLQSCVQNIMFNKDSIPKTLPCAIVILDAEDGIKPTSRQFTSTDIAWTVYLIVNAQNVDDPDLALYNFKEEFRENYLKFSNRDIPHIEYYTSRIDGTRLVRIAKLDLLKSGSGAAS